MVENKTNTLGIAVAVLVVAFLIQGFFYFSFVSSFNEQWQEINGLRSRTENIVAFINQALAQQQ